MKWSSNALRIIPRVEELEQRQVLSGYNPTVVEQVFLERLNDARADPAAYGDSIGKDFSYIAPSQPLAFDTRLIKSARDHSRDMSNQDFFGHTGSDGSTAGQRIKRQGYDWWAYSESIAAGFTTPEAALKALIIDAGVSNLGHRKHLLGMGTYNHQHQAVGIGIVLNGSGRFGNYYTIDSGYTENQTAYLTGVVFSDFNGNGRYDAGEGAEGATVSVQGGPSKTIFSTGGYSLRLNPGTYLVTASGGNLVTPITQEVTVGKKNVRLNFDTEIEPNKPPVLANIANKSLSTLRGYPTITLSASDPNDDPLTFTATVRSEAHYLDRELGLSKGSSYKLNRYGLDEKWLNGRDGEKYFILPNGELYRRIGEEGAEGELIATLDPLYYLKPSKLHKAKRGGTVTVIGDQLTVMPSDGFIGNLLVTVTVSDGRGGSDEQTFIISVS